MDENELTQKMQKILDQLVSDIQTIRTGRVNSGLLEDLAVAVYGGQQKLTIKEIASIQVSDPQTLVVDPWDKSIIGEIKQGIMAANVGMNPMIDGELIRITLPPLTTEDKEKYIKLLSTKIEGGKVAVRQCRGDAMRDIKSDFEEKNISEDEKFRLEKRVQEITDDFVKKIDEAGDKKKEELMQV